MIRALGPLRLIQKKSNIFIVRVLELEKKEDKTKKAFKEIMTEIFPHLTQNPTNLQIYETEQNPKQDRPKEIHNTVFSIHKFMLGHLFSGRLTYVLCVRVCTCAQRHVGMSLEQNQHSDFAHSTLLTYFLENLTGFEEELNLTKILLFSIANNNKIIKQKHHSQTSSQKKTKKKTLKAATGKCITYRAKQFE